MTRQSFYRKYRSQNFDEIVGQEHVVQTLKNAIENKRLSHAYIFSGPRGTGKTSIARIFAKTENTFQETQQLIDLNNPICDRITKGICVDVVEIDAASNTGVDNIRDLNDKVNFTPVECKTKFYIIDEAHMLSTGAFNALLKTLEEPPSHTIFILATTEPHKIPITIHSRCQHLRFRNLKDHEIIHQLTHVIEKESIAMSENAKSIIARNSSGCMRDALSLLDQMYSFKGQNISDEDVLMVLGTIDLNQLTNLISYIFQGQCDPLLHQLQQCFEDGINPFQLLQDLTQLTRQVMALQSKCDQLVKINRDILEKLATQSQFKLTTKLLECLAKTDSECRWFSDPSLLIEIRLIQFVQENILNKDEANSVQNKVAIPSKNQSAPTQQLSQAKTTQTFSPNQNKQPLNSMNNQKQNKTGFDIPKSVPTIPTKQETSHAPVHNIPSIPDIKKTTSAEPHKQVSNSPVVQATHSKEKIETLSEMNQAQPIQESPKEITLESARKSWPTVLEGIKLKKPALFSILKGSGVVGLKETKITIQLQQTIQFFVEKLTEEPQRVVINQILTETFGKPFTFELHDNQQDNNSASISTPDSSTSQQLNASHQQSQPAKRINSVVSMFEGKVL